MWVNHLEMIATEVKALEIVDCNILVRTPCDGLDTVVAQVECHQCTVAHKILDTANTSHDVNTEQPVSVYLKCWMLLLVIDKHSRVPRLGNILKNFGCQLFTKDFVFNSSNQILTHFVDGKMLTLSAHPPHTSREGEQWHPDKIDQKIHRNKWLLP